MCRWLAYSGAPIHLDEVLFKTDHSLIDQSLRATDSANTTNGDGFGIGWYGKRDVPGVYKDIRPAWNDSNLQALAAQIESPMFLAHVRATTGSPVQRTNCHPFNYEKWLFVHNGAINEFEKLHRDLAFAVSPELFQHIGGSTDSELMFLLALTLVWRAMFMPGYHVWQDSSNTLPRTRYRRCAANDARYQRRRIAVRRSLFDGGRFKIAISQCKSRCDDGNSTRCGPILEGRTRDSLRAIERSRGGLDSRARGKFLHDYEGRDFLRAIRLDCSVTSSLLLAAQRSDTVSI